MEDSWQRREPSRLGLGAAGAQVQPWTLGPRTDREEQGPRAEGEEGSRGPRSNPGRVHTQEGEKNPRSKNGIAFGWIPHQHPPLPPHSQPAPDKNKGPARQPRRWQGGGSKEEKDRTGEQTDRQTEMSGIRYEAIISWQSHYLDRIRWHGRECVFAGWGGRGGSRNHPILG